MKAFLILSALCVGLFFRPITAASQDETSALVERLIQKENLDKDQSAYLRKLTPPLFEYLRTGFPPEVLAPLYQAESLAGLRLLLEKQLGRDVLDFGAKMFEFFETEAGKGRPADLKTWKAASTERFVFYYRPGSRAEEDLDFILASSVEALAAITSSLDIGPETARNFKVLRVGSPPETSNVEKVPTSGRIDVYLYPSRASAGDKIKKSMGAMSFGATILSEGPDKGAGRLTARIDVLYLNALSLAVLHHEIAHAALFLGSFDPGALTARPLQGESGLKKAFFAGYRPISPFLHEGIGDYILYYQVICPRWPLLPSAADLVRFQIVSQEYIPLPRLLKEGAAFRAQHRKAYALEAASVVDFLIRGHGPGKLKAWFQSPDADGLRSFEKVYGFSVKELETRWKASLSGESRT